MPAARLPGVTNCRHIEKKSLGGGEISAFHILSISNPTCYCMSQIASVRKCTTLTCTKIAYLSICPINLIPSCCPLPIGKSCVSTGILEQVSSCIMTVESLKSRKLINLRAIFVVSVGVCFLNRVHVSMCVSANSRFNPSTRFRFN